jgi:hypothetical protein
MHCRDERHPVNNAGLFYGGFNVRSNVDEFFFVLGFDF